ncbi:MAG: cell division protein ZapA [Elusimicrobia bacterium]|nr:cell division protein ZapA [Elusimicrobiota bacterium]MBU2615390.1 cell division protein ZapA [Elusimicrobiota bacterium]
MSEKVAVGILGKTYTLETDIDPLELQARAKYVEEKLKEASPNSDRATSSDVAVLTALIIADELFNLKTNYENLKSMVNKKSNDLISVIDRALEP